MKKIVLWGVAALLAATAQAALQTRDLGQGSSPQDMVNALLGGGVSVSKYSIYGRNQRVRRFLAGVMALSGSRRNSSHQRQRRQRHRPEQFFVCYHGQWVGWGSGSNSACWNRYARCRGVEL